MKKTEDKPQLPHLVKDTVVLEHLPISRRQLANLMKLKNDPFPHHKVGKSLLFDLNEAALWWQRWTKRPRSEQEVLDIEQKKTRQRGRVTVLSGKRKSVGGPLQGN